MHTNTTVLSTMDLPPPGPQARAASEQLVERIAREVESRAGWISFARYMELALYAPGLGYYAGGSTKLGAAGDFVTAPELGMLFGRTLARQVAELLPADGDVLEFGAGSGALAVAVLAELQRLGRTPREYLILEPSAELAGRQRDRLQEAGFTARWISRLPHSFSGIALANEVLDALPAHALAWTRDGILERGVSMDAGNFVWRERPATGEVLRAAQALDIELPPSGRYESELNLAARAWVRSIAAILREGALLVSDYGFGASEYYHPQRSSGTLMCHYRHRSHGDPFYLPGLQDITAHVDFSALLRAGEEAGLQQLGYATQAQFLINCGITALLAQADASDARRYAPLAAEAQKLMSPAEMGELFKVLALGKSAITPLGFCSGNRLHTL